MTTHDHIRHEQSIVLRDSLLGSSLSYLTLAVALLLAASLRTTAPIDEPAAPEWIPEPIDIRNYVPLPESPGAPAPTPVATAPGPLVAIDDETLLRDQPALEPSTVAPPVAGALPGTGGSAGSDPGITVGGGRALPPPSEYIPHDEVPQVVVRVAPAYPEVALQAHLEGRVVVRAFVGTDGRVVKAEVEGKPSLFDEAATSAVARWVFTPALAGAHPVAVWVRVPVVFRLE